MTPAGASDCYHPRVRSIPVVVGVAARTIDVRFVVSMLRKRDSSNHSHDHTHDHYHRRPGVSDDSPHHSLPLVSAPGTHDHSHVRASLLRDIDCRQAARTT